MADIIKIKMMVWLFLMSSLTTNAQTSSKVNINTDIKTADSFFMARNWAKARQVYETALKDNAQNSLAWNRLGFSNYNLSIYEEALKCFQKSLSLSPPNALKIIVYTRMARIYALQNKRQTAYTALDSAVNLGYSNVAEVDTLTDYGIIRNESQFKLVRERVYKNANPCMSDAHAREFDFWVGEWDVFVTGKTQYAGHSIVQIISGGCAILENWESRGSNGKSINFIDPVTNQWKQSWAGNYANGIQEFTQGEYKDSAMSFKFETTDAKGNKIAGRFIFFNQGPNQVRQFNETSVDDGKTWITSYDFTYRRK